MGKYPDITQALSYNALINCFVGNRGGGKTYMTMKHCIDSFIKSKFTDQWVYVRRTDKVIRDKFNRKKGDLFADMAPLYPEFELSCDGNAMLLDDGYTTHVMGYGTALSMGDDFKSSPYPGVRNIFLEEFIITNTRTHQYLPREIELFYDLYETVARPGSEHKRVQVFMCANAVTITNPYFDEWRLEMPEPGKIRRFGPDGNVIVWNVVMPDFVVAKKESEFGRLIDGSRYADYAIENKWLLDTSTFLGKKPQWSRLRLNLVYDGVYYGVWEDTKNWLYYCSTDHNRDCPDTYPVTTDDHMPNTMLAKVARKLPCLKLFMESYECGAVRFESVRVKNKFRDIMRILRGRD